MRILSAPLVSKYYYGRKKSFIVTVDADDTSLFCRSLSNGVLPAIFESIKVGPSLQPTDGGALLSGALSHRENMLDVMLEKTLESFRTF